MSNPKSLPEVVFPNQLVVNSMTPFSGVVTPLVLISMKNGTIWPRAMSFGAKEVTASLLLGWNGAA